MWFKVRRRDAKFPAEVNAKVQDAQPAALPHADFTVHGAFLRMQECFPGQEKYYIEKDYDILKYVITHVLYSFLLKVLFSVWRVLRGPNDDWPLALCDFESINISDDIVANDVVHENVIGENALLYHNPAHAWYYLPQQTPEDLIMFRNASSRPGKSRKCLA